MTLTNWCTICGQQKVGDTHNCGSIRISKDRWRECLDFRRRLLAKLNEMDGGIEDRAGVRRVARREGDEGYLQAVWEIRDWLGYDGVAGDHR